MIEIGFPPDGWFTFISSCHVLDSSMALVIQGVQEILTIVKFDIPGIEILKLRNHYELASFGLSVGFLDSSHMDLQMNLEL
jgi:hypothetical protein